MTHSGRKKREEREEARWKDEENCIGREGEKDKHKRTEVVGEKKDRLRIVNDNGGDGSKGVTGRGRRSRIRKQKKTCGGIEIAAEEKGRKSKRWRKVNDEGYANEA